VIKSFKDKETEKIFNRLRSSKLPSDIQQIALRKLRILNRVQTIQELKITPANRLEKLKGERLNQYSIRINNQWRICFEWQDNNAFNVEIVDYH
jgi:toxin HigB-1